MAKDPETSGRRTGVKTKSKEQGTRTGVLSDGAKTAPWNAHRELAASEEKKLGECHGYEEDKVKGEATN